MRWTVLVARTRVLNSLRRVRRGRVVAVLGARSAPEAAGTQPRFSRPPSHAPARFGEPRRSPGGGGEIKGRAVAWLRLLLVVAVLAGPTSVAAQPPPTPPGQEEFVPLSEVPPSEQIPAFTLVAAAYAFVWLALMGYVWSVSQRLQKVEKELTQLGRGGA
jgi:CcmD family protein